MLTGILQDFTHAARVFRKSPLFTLAAAGTLALGIGAATTIFALLNGVLLRPLPYPDPDRLALIWETSERMRQMLGYREIPASPMMAQLWREQARSLEQVGLFSGVRHNFAGEGPAERLRGARVTSGVFGALGIHPVMGRVIDAAEEEPGRDGVIVLSYGLWESRFQKSPSIVGERIRVDDTELTVIGVMPPGFNFPRGSEHVSDSRIPEETQFWRPLALSPAEKKNLGNHSIGTIARLRHGASAVQSQQELASLSLGLYSQVSPAAAKEFQVAVNPYREQMVARTRPAILMLGAAVLLLLLVACVNVAGLLVVQSIARRREMALRAAVGAAPARLARQVLAESLLLGAAGALGGALLALWGVHLIRSLAGGLLPRFETVSVDSHSLGFAILVSLATACLFGLAPALSSIRVDLAGTLKESGRASGTAGHHRLRTALVVAQISLSMVLLSGSGLLLRSFWQLMQAERGFQVAGVLTMRIPLPRYQYPEPTQRHAFLNEVLRNVQNLPMVESAGLVNQLPLTGEGNIHAIRIEGRSARAAEEPIAEVRETTPGYFAPLRTPLRRGRWLTAADGASAAHVAVVSETMASTFWPAEDPIGKRFIMGERAGAPWITVVGVCADARQARLDKAPHPQFYIPFEISNSTEMTLAVRSSMQPEAITAAIRAAVRRLDSSQPLTQIKTLDQILDEGIADRKLQTFVLLCFAVFALLLSAVGLHGIIAFAVAQRTREFGIRLALGAGKQQIFSLVAGHGLTVALGGVVLGLACAFAAGRLLSGFLYGVQPTDTATFAAVTGLMVLCTAVATLGPAVRAMRLDPIRTLRDE